ncbi:MAG: triose-phosphate isomerase [Anaerolineaceae bacterium]|nr:triose-phosphate isomerase [Anaerolineaceae bacterium]
MRTPIVAGNWKMNKTAAEAVALVKSLLDAGMNDIEGVEKVVCPTFTALNAVSDLCAGTEVAVGAQNLYFEASGAYTGEIAPNMVKEFCDYVIIGHSERRGYFGETDESVNKKLKAAFEIGLTPILCVGETYEENQAGKTKEIVTTQVKADLAGLTGEQVASMVIAYEPIWAIGTGLAADAELANQVIRDFVRTPVAELFGNDVAQAMRIQYGGSVKPSNAEEYFSMPDIDGALVGGASLKVDFIDIVKAAAATR